MTPAKPPSKNSDRPRIDLDLIEEIGLLRALRTEFTGARLDGDRILVGFRVTPKHMEQLGLFRSGRGPKISASDYSLGINWARSIIFGTRRRLGKN